MGTGGEQAPGVVKQISVPPQFAQFAAAQGTSTQHTRPALSLIATPPQHELPGGTHAGPEPQSRHSLGLLQDSVPQQVTPESAQAPHSVQAAHGKGLFSQHTAPWLEQICPPPQSRQKRPG